YYADYETNRHPEPIDHEELEDILEESINKQKQDQKEAKENTPAKKAEKRLRDELGDRFKFREPYRAALERVRPQIDEMREFFSTLLDERVVQIRRLKRASSDGMILNPSALSQTIVDLKTGIKNPPEAFLDYDKREKETQANGRFDCYLAVDCSGSMEGVRTLEARKAALIFLEGLSAFQKDIESRQQQGSIDLDWDVRSYVYAFSTGAELIKPLTSSLTEKERLDVFSSISNPAGTTEDFMALESICEGIKLELGSKPENKNRRRIVIVLTDGESVNPERLASSINELNKLLEPSSEFIKLAVRNIESRQMTANVVDYWKDIVRIAIQEWAKLQNLTNLISQANTTLLPNKVIEKNLVITTDEELEVFEIFKSICGDERPIQFVDNTSYFKIHIQDKPSKTIARFFTLKKGNSISLPLSSIVIENLSLAIKHEPIDNSNWVSFFVNSKLDIYSLKEAIYVAYDSVK
ncbi:MAG: hypothetical protein WCO91_07140, partial [Gemmataceae bacterium]